MSSTGTENTLSVEEEEKRIDNALELEETIRETHQRFNKKKEYIGGDSAVVTGVKLTGKTIDSSNISGLDVHGDPGDVPQKIDVQYVSPDGSHWRTTFDFPQNSEDPFFRLLDHINIPRDKPSELIQSEIPVTYTEDKWKVHVPPKTTLRTKLVYKWNRFLLNRGWIVHSEQSRYNRLSLKRSGVKASIGGLLLYLLIAVAVNFATPIPLGLFLVLVPAIIVMIDIFSHSNTQYLQEPERIKEW